MMSNDYRIQATIKNGDTLLLITDSRKQALFYAGLLMQNPVYSIVSVTIGSEMYMGPAIGKIP